VLHSYTAACAVSAGGDIVFKGLPIDARYWPLSIEDPLDPTRSIAALRLGPSAVATSSVVKRSWKQGERLRHHLIDPRTRESAETDWLSVTVLAPDMALAEVYAKALLIAGGLEAPALAAQRPEISYVAVESGGALVASGVNLEEIREQSLAIAQ